MSLLALGGDRADASALSEMGKVVWEGKLAHRLRRMVRELTWPADVFCLDHKSLSLFRQACFGGQGDRG
jgi:hypothetical protein